MPEDLLDLRARFSEWHTRSVEELDDAEEESGGVGLDTAQKLPIEIALGQLRRGDLAVHSRQMVEVARELAARIEEVSRAVRTEEALERRRQSAQDRFELLVEQWRDETEFEPSLSRMVMNRAYQQIIGMGERAVPMLLRELADRPDHWFWALTSITGEDPASDCETVEAAAERWLAWGGERGLID